MLSMFFNANTKHFEYSSPLLLEDITYDDFGFEKGTRESTWIQETLNRLQTALQEELGEKKLMSKKRKEKIQIAHRAIILNRLYDFMFFCLENNIDFYPDFYLPLTKEIKEIKGYFSTKDKEKIQLVEIQNKIKIDLLFKKDLEDLGILV